jgi:hypothetical protein
MNSFKITWNPKASPNPNGIKPNSNSLINTDPSPIVIPKNSLSPYEGSNSDPTYGLIMSARYPYAIEHLYTKYGELETKLGTSIGS